MSDYSPLAQLEISSRTMCSEIDTVAGGIPFLPGILRFTTTDELPWLTDSDGRYSLIDELDATSSFRDRSKAIGVACSTQNQSNWDLLERCGTAYRPGVYRHMIRGIKEVDRAVVLQMLRWVSYAARPLSALELLDAISYQSGNKFPESDIERISGGLLTISEARRVNLVHLSLLDYLHSQNGEYKMLGWDAAPEISHEMITNTCFRHLRSMDLLDSQVFPALAQESDIVNHERRHGLYFYARKYWRFHYTRAEHQSYCLPGTLHERLRDGWKQRDYILANGFLERWTTVERNCRTPPSSSAVAFLDAALKEGARSGMIKLVKLELEMGACPNCPDRHGNTPLHYAAMAGHFSIVKILIEYGADTKLSSTFGHTALFHAIANRHIEVVELLLNVGLSPEITQLSPDQIENAHKWLCPLPQISLVVSLLSCCSKCCTTQSEYVLSKIPNTAEDHEKWPPIRITDKRTSLAACKLSPIRGNSRFGQGTLISEQRAILKWFPGISMYTALGMAAVSGMDDVLRLLILAGNGKQFLRSNTSLSKLMSSLNIS